MARTNAFWVITILLLEWQCGNDTSSDYSKIHFNTGLYLKLFVCKNSNQRLMKIEYVERRHTVQATIDLPQLYLLLSSRLKER